MSELVTGWVIDYADSSPVAGVTVKVLSNNPLAAGMATVGMTDSNGHFALPFDFADSYLTFDLAGYVSTSESVNDLLTGNGIVTIVPTNLPVGGGGSGGGSGSGGSTPTGGSKPPSPPSKPGILLPAALILLLLSFKNKQKSVGAVELQNYIIPIALVLVGYNVLQSLGILPKPKTPQQLDEESKFDADLNDALLHYSLSYASGNYYAWADDLYSQLSTSWGTASISAQETAAHDLMQMKNIADVLMLRKAFGLRPGGGGILSLCQLLSMNCKLWDLDGWIKENMSADYIQAVNADYSNKLINYTF